MKYGVLTCIRAMKSMGVAVLTLTLIPSEISARNNDSDLVAYYPLNGNARDRSGNRLHGTLFGTDPTEDRHGKKNRALLFDGVSDHIDLGNPPEFNFEGDFTLSVWVKFSEDQVNRYIIAKYDFGPGGGSAHSYGLGTAGGTEAYGFVLGDGPDYEDVFGQTALGDGSWHAVSFVFREGLGIELFVDGQSAGFRPVLTYPAFVNDVPLFIGATFSGQNFAGAIDDVRIYNRALSGTEIADQFLDDAPLPERPIAYYPLDGNARDRSGNHLHGRVSGTSRTTDRFGRRGGALQFDGIDDYVNLGNRSAFKFQGSFSLSTWLKLDGAQPAKYIISKYDFPDNPKGSYGLGTAELSQSYGFVWGEGPSYEDIRGTFSLDDGEWHAVVFVFEEGTAVRLYVDGALASSSFAATSGPFESSTPLYLGGTFSGQNFGGALDDVRIYDYPLSNLDVAVLYRSDLE